MHKRLPRWLGGILIALFFASPLLAQLPEAKIRQIDSLFIAWDAPNHPGGSVGVMLDGKLVYARAFGLASLEYLVPNTFDTRFNIASVSKQFTAFGICLLQLQGKLSVDDDIRTYLTELPEFKHKITIRHLLHHTSGLRSLHTLLALAGWRRDDARTNEDLMRFMKRQRDLNFVPGSEYMYCNTGYIFMAEIIQRVTGQEFTQWMQENVFRPLGMNHTYVERHYDRVVRNNATSYYPTREGGFRRAVEYWGYVGSGNIHTNVSDLLIWLEQLRDPSPQWKAAFELLKTTDPLNDGKPNDYAFGITVNRYKGELRIGHGGSIGGFRSQVYTFPERKLSIVVLTNFSTANPGGKASAIVDIILDKPRTPARRPTFRLSPEAFDKIAGRYQFSNSADRTIDLFRIGGQFFLEEKGQERRRLTPIGENRFRVAGSETTVKVVVSKGKEPKLEIAGASTRTAHRIRTFAADEKTLQEVCGTYWSPELETQYVLYLEDGKLKGHHTRHGDFDIRYVREDEFNGAPSFFNFFRVKRDSDGKITGILVTNSRVRDLWFEKR